jgi:hypothetical protein
LPPPKDENHCLAGLHIMRLAENTLTTNDYQDEAETELLTYYRQFNESQQRRI